MIIKTTTDAEYLRLAMEVDTTAGQTTHHYHQDSAESATTSAFTWKKQSNQNFVENFSGSSSVDNSLTSTSVSYVENYTSETTHDSTTSGFTSPTFGAVKGEVHAVEYRIGLGCLMCVVMSVAIAGNFLVLLAISRTRSLRRLNNFLLVSLAISDFLCAITCMPLFITELFNDYEWTLPNDVCSYYISLQLSFLFLSTWNIAAISMERVFLIMFPMIYQRSVTERRMIAFIVGLWIVSLIYGMSQLNWFNSEPWLSWSSEHPEFCRYVPSIVYAIVDFVVCFALPLCIMFGAYLKIYCIVQSQMNRIHPALPNAWNDPPFGFSTTNYMSQIYNEKRRIQSQFSSSNPPAEERNTDSSQNFRHRETEVEADYDLVAHALRKISTEFTDVQSLGADHISRPDSELESDTYTKQHIANNPATKIAWTDEDSGKLGTCNKQLTINDVSYTGHFNRMEMMNNGVSMHQSPMENATNHSCCNSGDDDENTNADDTHSATPTEHRVQDNSVIELTNTITEGKFTDTIEKNVNFSTVIENMSDPNLQLNYPQDTYLENEIKFVTSNHSPNLQLRATDSKLNREIRNYSAESPGNSSANRPIDPTNQNDPNELENPGGVGCGDENKEDQIHIQGNKTITLSPKSDPRYGDQSGVNILNMDRGITTAADDDSSNNEILLNVDDADIVKDAKTDFVNDRVEVALVPKSAGNVSDIDRGIKTSADNDVSNNEIQVNVDDVEEDNPENLKKNNDRKEETENDVFLVPVMKQLRHTSSDLETTLKKVSVLTNTLNIPIDDSLATATHYHSRPHSHEGERSIPRPLRSFSDPEPERPVFNAGIEINISRSSSRDGLGFPLRRASSARPDLNSISLDHSAVSSYSGFRSKLHPVLKTSFKTVSAGNLTYHNGPTPGRKRNSVVFRLYDDEILPDDDPNIVQTIPKLKVSVGTTEDTTTTETSGIGTAEITLMPDHSIVSNDAVMKKNVRGENARDSDPSRTHTSQWTKKHFNVSRDQSSTSARSRGGSGASSLRTSSITRRFRENKAVRMTAAVIGAFVLCILPYKIMFMMRVRDMSSVSDMGWNIVSLLMFVTNALNPFIYNFYNSSFRAAIRRLILCKGTPIAPAT